MRLLILFLGLAAAQEWFPEGRENGDAPTILIREAPPPPAVVELENVEFIFAVPAMLVHRPPQHPEHVDLLRPRPNVIPPPLNKDVATAPGVKENVGSGRQYQQVSQGQSGQQINTGYGRELTKQKELLHLLKNATSVPSNKSDAELRQLIEADERAAPLQYRTVLVKDKAKNPLEEKEKVEKDTRQAIVDQGPSGQAIYGPQGQLVNQGPQGQTIAGPWGLSGVSQGPQGQSAWSPGGYVGQGAQGQSVYGRPYYRAVLVKEEKKPLEGKEAERAEFEFRQGYVSQGPAGQQIYGARPWGYGGSVNQGAGGQQIGTYGPGGYSGVAQGPQGQSIYARPYVRAVLVKEEKVKPSEEPSPTQQTARAEHEFRQGYVNQGPAGQQIYGAGPYGLGGSVNQGPAGQQIGTYGPGGYSGVAQGPQGQSIYARPYVRAVLVKEEKVKPSEEPSPTQQTARAEYEFRQGYVNQGPAGQQIYGTGPYGLGSSVNQGLGGQQVAGYGPGGYSGVGQGAQGQSINTSPYIRAVLVKEENMKPLEGKGKETERAEYEFRQGYVGQGAGGQQIYRPGPWGYGGSVNQGAGGQQIAGYGPPGLGGGVSQGPQGQTISGPYVRALLVKEKKVNPLEEKRKETERAEPEFRQGFVNQGPAGQQIAPAGPYGYDGYVTQGPGGQQVVGAGPYGYGGTVNQGAGGQSIYNPGWGYPSYANQGAQGQNVWTPGGYVGQSGQGQTVAAPAYRIFWGKPPTQRAESPEARQVGLWPQTSVNQGPAGQQISTQYPYSGGAYVGQSPSGQTIAAYRGSLKVKRSTDAVLLKEDIKAARQYASQEALRQNTGTAAGYKVYP